MFDLGNYTELGLLLSKVESEIEAFNLLILFLLSFLLYWVAL